MGLMDGQATMGDVGVPREIVARTRETPHRSEDDIEDGSRRSLDGERSARESAIPESPPTQQGDGIIAASAEDRPRSSLATRSFYELRPRSSLGMRSFYDLIRRHSSADDDGAGDTVSRSFRLPSVLLRIPNTAFGVPMGLAGHAIMWRSLGRADRLDALFGRDGVASVGRLCWYSACVTGGSASALYGYKIATSFALVRAEYLNEVRCHFFNAPNLIFIMLLLGAPDDVEVSDDGESPLSLWFYWLIRALIGRKRTRSTNISFFCCCRSAPGSVGLFILLPCDSDEQHLQNVDVQQAEELHRRQASVSNVDGRLVLAGGFMYRELILRLAGGFSRDSNFA